MPSCSKAKNPRGIEITFTEEDHSYISLIDGKEIKYISGTTFLGRYFPPFDPTGAIAERCAKKEGLTVEEIKAKWSAKGKESCRLGTRLHETIEDILLQHPLRNVAENPTEQQRFNNGIAVAQKIFSSADILGVEKIVFSDRLKIAGTIDLLLKSRKTDFYVIVDHKTNQSIDQFNAFKQHCLKPISHLDDTNYIHYALQLSLYEYLLKYEGYVPENAKFKRFLNHVTPTQAKFIELPDFQNEIKDLIIDYFVNGSIKT